jgi:hypothetical protein
MSCTAPIKDVGTCPYCNAEIRREGGEFEAPATGGIELPIDMELVYKDPRGLILHKSKNSNRWSVTQLDPKTGQSDTFELQAPEIKDLTFQLARSPYWLPGKNPK